MGRTSEHAEGLLSQLSLLHAPMACQLVVHEGSGAVATASAQYGSGCRVHVEDMLLHLLKEKYGSLSAIPENSKIVLYGYWRPCKFCMDHTIPSRLSEMKIVERNLRVRFRFNQYYTASSWEAQGKSVRSESGGHYFWESTEAAEEAYTKLAGIYGRFPMKSRSTSTSVVTSTSPRVAFVRGLGTARTTTWWPASDRGKIWSDGKLIA